MSELAQIRNGFVGLTTARSADATPPGGLLEAENVCIRTKNVITPRPAFEGLGLPPALTTEALGRVEFPIGDNEAGLLIDAGKTLWDGHSASSGTVVDEDAANLTWNSYEGVVARRNLFLCTADALRRITEPGVDVAYRAGAPAPALSAIHLGADTLASDGGPAFASDGYRSYRAVTLRVIDSGGQSIEVRSAPSARLVLYEGTTPTNSNLLVLLHDDSAAGDVIELYASETSTTTPVDEHYLVLKVTVTAAHVTAGFFEVVDDVPNENLGAALYTNASREGAEGANERPPAVGCMALFNNSLWLGDLTYPAELTVDFPIKLAGAGASLSSPKYVNRYTFTGTFTAGGTSVTGLSSTTELLVDMLIVQSHGVYRVTAVNAGASSMTLSANWGGSSGAAAFTACDSIRIGSEYYPVGDLVNNIRGVAGQYWRNEAYTASTLYTAEYASDQNEPNALVAQSGVFSGYITNIALRIACMLPSTTAPEVWATHGSLYSPALPEPTVATGYQMPQDILPDHVAWSKAGEPDHFPFTQIERVGDGGAQVMALGESRQALVIATDQGLWRGFGHADSGIAFSELDKDVRILGRRCMAAVGPMQYVAADRGVFECDENGATSLTNDRINDLDALFKLIKLERASALKLVSNAKDDEVLVCVPDDEDAGQEINALYVFNTDTRAWTKWTLPYPVLDVTRKGREALIVATINGAEAQLSEVAGGYDAHPVDYTLAGVTVDAVTGTAVTLAANAFGLEVGDVIIDGSTKFFVTAVASSTSITVHAAGLTTGAKTARKAFTCTITPSVNTLKTAHFMKVWAEGAIHWARRVGVYAYSLAFRSAITGASSATTQTRILANSPSTNADARSAPSASRFTVARAAARGTHLCFSLVIRQAGSDWAIEALSVRARTTADKAPARLP